MSWLYHRPRRESEVPEVKQDTSQRDTATMAVLAQLPGASNDGVDEAGNAVINVPFLCQDEALDMMVRLPLHFPNAPPNIRIAGILREHPWLDGSNAVVGNPKLARWYPHYDIVQAISETKAYFQHTPPRLPHTSPDATPVAEPAARRVSSEVFHTPMPAVPAKFPQLNDMTTAEHQRLIDDEVAREALVDDLQVVVDYRNLLEDTRAANLATAKALEEREEGILNMRDSCLILQSELRQRAQEHGLLAQSTAVKRSQVEEQLDQDVAAAEEQKEDEGLRLEDGVNLRDWTETFLAKAAEYHRLNALREVLSKS